MTILTQLQSISAGEAGLAQAKSLLAGLSATVANASANTTYLLYTGYASADTTGLNIASQIPDIVADSNGQVVSIFETEIGQALKSEAIQAELARIANLQEGTKEFDTLMGGDFDRATGVRTANGFWDDASIKYTLTPENTRFQIIAPNPLAGTTYVANEVPALVSRLEAGVPTEIKGIPTDQLKAVYEEAKVFSQSSGKDIHDIFANDVLKRASVEAARDLDVVVNGSTVKLVSLIDNAAEIIHSTNINFTKLGVAGTLLSVGLTAAEANAAYKEGDYAKAQDIVSRFVAENVGGAAVGWAFGGLTAVGIAAAATAGFVIVAPLAITLGVVAVVAGNVIGSIGARNVYDLLSKPENTNVGKALSDSLNSPRDGSEVGNNYGINSATYLPLLLSTGKPVIRISNGDPSGSDDTSIVRTQLNDDGSVTHITSSGEVTVRGQGNYTWQSPQEADGSNWDVVVENNAATYTHLAENGSLLGSKSAATLNFHEYLVIEKNSTGQITSKEVIYTNSSDEKLTTPYNENIGYTITTSDLNGNPQDVYKDNNGQIIKVNTTEVVNGRTQVTTTNFDENNAITGYVVSYKDSNGFDVTINKNSQGNIIRSVTTSTLADGRTQTITAIPNVGSHKEIANSDGTAEVYEYDPSNHVVLYSSVPQRLNIAGVLTDRTTEELRDITTGNVFSRTTTDHPVLSATENVNVQAAFNGAVIDVSYVIENGVIISAHVNSINGAAPLQGSALDAYIVDNQVPPGTFNGTMEGNIEAQSLITTVGKELKTHIDPAANPVQPDSTNGTLTLDRNVYGVIEAANDTEWEIAA